MSTGEPDQHGDDNRTVEQMLDAQLPIKHSSQCRRFMFRWLALSLFFIWVASALLSLAD